MSLEDLEVQLVTTLEALDALRDEWRSAYDAADATPYSSFEWVRSYVANVDEPGHFCACFVRDSAGLVGILPFQVKPRLFSTSLTLLAGGQSPGNTAVLTERARGRGVLRAACEAVTRQHCRWDHCDVGTVDERSLLFQELTSPEWGELRPEARPTGTNVRIGTTASWEEFTGGLSKSHRQNVFRRIRGLRKLGTVEHARLGPGERPGESGDGWSAEDLDRRLEEAIVICRNSWQGSATTGKAMCDDDQVGFFRDVSRQAAARGMLDFSILYLDGRPVSYLWGMARAPVSNITALGFEPDLKAQSPGLAHLGMQIEDSIERGLEAIDFGHKYREYKAKWSKAGYGVHDFLFFASPRASRLRKRLQDRWSGSVLYRLRKLRERMTG